MADVSQWYWEIWNEPDYPGFWNGTNSSEATSAKMTDYYALYDAAVGAVTAVIPSAFVGGPATTQSSPHRRLLAALQERGHAGDLRLVPRLSGRRARASTSADANGLVTDNNSRISQITSGGYTTSTVMSFNTEWNSSYSGQGGGTGDVVTSMDNNWNVGFILKGMKLLSDKNSGNTPPIGAFFVLGAVGRLRRVERPLRLLHSRPNGKGNAPLRPGVRSHDLPGDPQGRLQRLQDVELPRPHAPAVGRRHQQRRRRCHGHHCPRAGDSLQILAYDYYATLNTTGTDSVTVKVSNLPSALAGKQVFVTQFVVDATHSNPYSVWTSQGKPDRARPKRSGRR